MFVISNFLKIMVVHFKGRVLKLKTAPSTGLSGFFLLDVDDTSSVHRRKQMRGKINKLQIDTGKEI